MNRTVYSILDSVRDRAKRDGINQEKYLTLPNRNRMPSWMRTKATTKVNPQRLKMDL